MSPVSELTVDRGCGCAWAKSDAAGLARFVDPGAIRWVRPEVAPFDVSADPAGRLTLVRSLYEQLAGLGIRYALEEWNPDDRCQTIRTVAEVIDRPALGTCLDLSTTFAGMCLGLGLLPIVAVTERHALVLISLRHGADEWRSFGRPELARFSPHPLADVSALREMIDDGRYVAVETTGFAATDALPATSPEGEGRVDRLLTFERAVAAGRRRFNLVDDPLRFAIDIAATHGSGIGPQRICRELRRVLVDDHVLVFGSAGARADRQTSSATHELRALPPAQPPPPRPTRGIFGREREQEFLRTATPGGLVGVWGAEGIGKSELLRWLAYEPAPGDVPDGTLYVRREGCGPLDLLQEVFERCFDPPDRVQLTMSSAARVLGSKRARLLIDDLDLPPSDVGGVLDALAEWAVVATAAGPTALIEGTSMAIAPLSPVDATSLFARESGVDVDGPIGDRLAAVFSAIGTNPRSVSIVGRAVATGDLPLDTFLSAGVVDGPAEPDGSGPVAAILRAAYPAFVHRRHFSGLTDDVDAELDALCRLEVAETGSPRYRWVGGPIGGSLRDPGWDMVLVERVATWLAGAPPPDEIVEDRELLLRAMEIATSVGRWNDVVRLGRAIEPWLAIGNRWDAWGQVLSALGEGARNTGDPVLEAYCHHQFGTRALALGDSEAAVPELERAREMRERLGDRAGAEVSRHNLELVRTPTPTLWGRVGRLARGHPWFVVIATVVVLVVVIGALAGGNDDGGSPVSTVPPLVSVEVESLDLGPVPIGGSKVGELVVVNVGDGPIDVSAIDVDGSDEVTLVEVGTICADVPARGRCAVSVNLAPVREEIVQASVALVVDGESVVGVVSGTSVQGLVLEADDGFEAATGSNVAAQRFRLRSVADVAIDGVAVRVEPTDGPFAIGSDCPVRFEPGAVCEFDVVSDVPVGEDATGVLVVSVAETTIQATLSLSGVDPAAFDIRVPAEFGDVLVGGTAEMPAVLANVGGSVGSPSVAPVDPSGGFAVDASRCTDVEPGAECELVVSFAPTEARVYELPVSLGGREVIIASGAGLLGPVVQVEGDLDFGTVFFGDGLPVVRRVTIVNDGDRAAELRSVDVSGSGFDQQSVARECVGQLGPGERCDLDVVFAPRTTGVYEGELFVDIAGADSVRRQIQAEFKLGGSATFAAVFDEQIREQLDDMAEPQEWLERYDVYDVNPSDLDFTQETPGPVYDAGDVARGFRAMLIVLRNGGDAPLEIRSVTNAGPDDASFSIVDGCSGVTLQPGDDQNGEFCRIGVAAVDVPGVGAETRLELTYGPRSVGPSVVTITAFRSIL